MASRYQAANFKPQGPGDARPTTIQILQDEGLLTVPNRLSGKTVLVTGGTSGLGLEVAKALQQTGAKVFISGRCDTATGGKVASSIYAPSDSASYLPVRFVRMDLSDLDSVKNGAETFLSDADGSVNLLVCNAGLMMPPEYMTTKQNHEIQFGVNHLAHFLLFEKLRSALLKSSTENTPSRVVVVSSCAHRNGGLVGDSDYDFRKTKYDAGLAYGQSKTANIYMANEVERKFGKDGLHGLSVHPGVIMDTGLVRHMTDDSKQLEEMLAQSPGFRDRTKSTLQGAGTILWTAVTASLDGKGGLFTEDCDVGRPVEKSADWWDPGTSEWCYNQDAEEKLWSDSMDMVKQWL